MTTTSSTPISPWLVKNERTGQSLMQVLFDRLTGMYPRRWRESFPKDPDVGSWERSWSQAFDSRGFTPQMIKRGLQNCEEMFEYPPTITQFIKACTTPGRDEPVAPMDNPALEYDAKFNPELAAKAAQAVKQPEDNTDHLRWVKNILRKFPNGSSSYAYRAALEVAKERGIKV